MVIVRYCAVKKPNSMRHKTGVLLGLD